MQHCNTSDTKPVQRRKDGIFHRLPETLRSQSHDLLVISCAVSSLTGTKSVSQMLSDCVVGLYICLVLSPKIPARLS